MNEQKIHLSVSLAPEKRGKSWMLLDVAYRAAQQKRRVAFYRSR